MLLLAVVMRHKDPNLVKALELAATGVDPLEAWQDCGEPTTRGHFQEDVLEGIPEGDATGDGRALYSTSDQSRRRVGRHGKQQEAARRQREADTFAGEWEHGYGLAMCTARATLLPAGSLHE